MSNKYVVQRWSGLAWYDSMCSPYKTMSEVTAHLKKYWWHYTIENPYRIIDFKPKKKVQRYVPKYNFSDWNSDKDMVVCTSYKKDCDI
jgi:hypothetical protein